MTKLRLTALNSGDAGRWDELTAPFPERSVFHRQAWLDYLAESRGVQIRKWAIRQEGEIVGYFCAGVLRKGPLRLVGSPLRGWGTNFMGPLVKKGTSPEAFLETVDILAGQEKWALFELEARGWSKELLSSANYTCRESWTYLVNLSGHNPESLLAQFEKSRRYGVRKAIKAGLTVEDTDDAELPDEFYDLHCELMRCKGLPPVYPREIPRMLFKHLRRAGCLLALRVRDDRGKILATGLFPYDERVAYYWGGASDKNGEQYCPNDLMHWTAMSMALERGVANYDLSGWGRYKKKFAGELLTVYRGHRAYWRSAGAARKLYEYYYEKKTKFLRQLHEIRVRSVG